MSDQINVETLNAILAMLQSGSGSRRRGKRKGAPRVKPTPEESEAHRKANDEECVRVFKAAGYTDVRPRVNVLVYGRQKPDGTLTGWLSKGRRVKAGENSLRVGPFNLFHENQTEPLTPQASTGAGEEAGDARA